MDTNGSDGGRKLAVYAITQWSDKQGTQRKRWTKVGVAFRNGDGSLNLLLHAFPIGSDKLQVREEFEDEARNGSREAAEVRS